MYVYQIKYAYTKLMIFAKEFTKFYKLAYCEWTQYARMQKFTEKI